jgi:hypothetical protein
MSEIGAPYLLSLGIGLPVFGVWMHKYVATKKKRPATSKTFLGCHIVYTTYQRKTYEASQYVVGKRARGGLQ